MKSGGGLASLAGVLYRLKMEPHGVFKEVTKQCTIKDHYQSVGLAVLGAVRRGLVAGAHRWLPQLCP